MRDIATTYIETRNKVLRALLFLIGIMSLSASGLAVIGLVLTLFVAQGEYPGMVEGYAFLGVLSFGIGILSCLPFYAIDTEGDLKGFLLRTLYSSDESTTDPIDEKIKSAESAKIKSGSKSKFMWEE